jgi:hypothetical protein
MNGKAGLSGAASGAATGAAFGPWGAVAGGVIGGIAGLMSDDGSDEEKRIAAMMDQNLKELEAIGMPPDTAREIVLHKYKSEGKLTPKLEEAVVLGPSKVAAIKEDPSLRAAGMSALERITGQASSGLSGTDRNNLNKIRRENARDTQAKLSQITQGMQQRGISGGAELAAQLSAAQGGAEEASMQGDRIADMASQRALQALSESGNLSSKLRGQDFDINNTRAAAEDQFSRFNTTAQIDRQSANINRENKAQERNLENEQRIADTNTRDANAELARQKEAQRADFLNKMALAESKNSARSGSAKNAAANLQNQRAADANFQSGLFGAAGSIGKELKNSGTFDSDTAKETRRLNEENALAEARRKNLSNNPSVRPKLY